MTEREKILIDLLERAKMCISAEAMRRKIDEAIALVRGSTIPSANRGGAVE